MTAVGPLPARELDRLAPARYVQALETGAAQRVGDHGGEHRIVVDDQNRLGRAAARPPRVRSRPRTVCL